jgi:hypothetical protein
MKLNHPKTTLIATILAVVGSSKGTVLAQDQFRIGNPLPQQVRDDWEQRRQSCRTAHWKLKFREMLAPGMLNVPPDLSVEKFGLLPKENSWRELGYETWLDFDSSRVRSEIFGETHHTHDDGRIEIKPFYSVYLFDGDSFQVYEPNDRNRRSNQNVELNERRRERAGLMFQPNHHPFFWGRGMLLGHGVDLHQGPPGSLPDYDTFRIRGYDVSNGLLAVRAPRNSGKGYLDYEIDLGKQSAIVRKAVYTAKNRLWSETNVEWGKEGDRWLPKNWSVSAYINPNGGLGIASECTVEIQECGVDLEDVVFHMTPEPGDKFFVEESRTAYVKGAEGEPDVPVKLAQIQASAKSRQRFWIVSLVLFAAALLGGTWWMRRRGVV